MQLIRALPILVLFVLGVFNKDSLLSDLQSQSAPSPPLTLQQNILSGSQLELSDGSLYEIAPADREKTSFWLTPIEITLAPSNDPLYPLYLTNSLTGVSVKGKRLRAGNIKIETN